MLGDDIELNGLGERFVVPPYGLDGGDPGGPNGIYVKGPTDNDWKTIPEALGAVSPSKFHNLRAASGTSFKIVTGGGGGYGDPLAREPQRVVGDVADGLVSREGAERDYGVVVVETDDGSIGCDATATDRLRLEREGRPSAASLTYRDLINTMKESSAQGAMKQQVAAEIRRVDDLVVRARKYIEANGITDPDSKSGRSLRNPFLNELALQFWDAYALERWAAWHDFDLGSP